MSFSGHLLLQRRAVQRRYAQHDSSSHERARPRPPRRRRLRRRALQTGHRPLQLRALVLAFLVSPDRPRRRRVRRRPCQLDGRITALVLRDRAVLREGWAYGQGDAGDQPAPSTCVSTICGVPCSAPCNAQCACLPYAHPIHHCYTRS